MMPYLIFNQIYFEEGTGPVIPSAENPLSAPQHCNTATKPSLAALHCTPYSEAALQDARGVFNIHVPFSTGTAEGTALWACILKAVFGDQILLCQQKLVSV